ncbi:MAG: AAA family ATPase [Microcystis panniformis Mp_MB_F_20051200_S9]|uniref:AAA family ATPase n=1 Tax=Microcystis panniformis Mp_MB_F_20051200_S9 TaxID=2486223 RepID=A0A552PIW4_9CHRO|nr:MAG: AAA family ATPase [Microcystis panniformis Mp_GB_SS_20050300_S99D]TRV45457.1 MAG: AAA family ATPase [Microcystis panniformis Mp_GB_SS_20050300_S99]TRV50422.1 MAG: AAA family ATPase [Microcystis panniformis Mp_MB_F_20080800_S26D]TRV56927.1 MAG: AAA family ATPase [Microcystis panniformis Mp_MB_F_20051200_S9]TRV63902.1 MAG: AAA family ATPase [Microcystis panniformis Mp_MB_F_20080800_S26]TRV67647.1 MAG: AAA family ATPase [Microcystis panniformis Mp_MB_F_20051200_S9D]TRV74552.1 MAG: AAA fa
MVELFKGFEQLVELAKTLEEKLEKGEIKTEVQFNSRPLSNIPRAGGIPRSGGVSRPSNSGGDDFEVNRNRDTPNDSGVEDSVTPAEGPTTASLKDVGGLTEVIKELKELIAIPLKRPDLLAKLGLEPTRGVLLVGPPGTGKTLTARALAEELGVNYIALVGPEVISKYYGEAEQKLRGIFEKASKNAPCIVFIDEIDSMAPDRSKVEGEVEKRLVAQLLGLMDGFAQSQGVIVLAATNRPDHLDPALRRPGRFDREVLFRVPDRKGRLEILQILTRSMPLDESVSLDLIADNAVGFVGSDLKAVCQKAAYSALRRQVPTIDSRIPETMTVVQADFLQALKEVKPAVLRSVEVESPHVDWDNIGGLEQIKQTLQESVEGALLHPQLYTQTKAQAPKGILLWGPPGTGKTLLAKAVASQARANFISINGPELLSKWVGASEQAVRELFAKARQAAPCVVFIDEIDTLAPARGRYSGDSGVSDRVVGQILTELDGLQTAATILVIGATNRPDALDPALLRAGRLDLQLKVDLPNASSRLAILGVHNDERPLEDVDLGYWAEATEGWNGADLSLLCNQAALMAIRRYRHQGMTDPADIRITTADFNHAYQLLVEQRAN